jgi:hypothetical protein
MGWKADFPNPSVAKDFPELLNVTIIQRIHLKDGKNGHVVLFSDDLDLSYDKMILYYRLRFQIEFTFRVVPNM